MCMVRWMCSNTNRDKVRYEDVLAKIRVPSYKKRCEKIAYNGLVMYDDLQMNGVYKRRIS